MKNQKIVGQRNIKIAFAEDQIIVRKGIIDLLHDFGKFNVIIEANDGAELISQLKSAELLPDICVIDISMRNMNGFDTVAAIKQNWPEMKMLVFTMHDQEYYMIRMFRQGVHGYLLKDCEPTELEIALLSIYNNGYYHSEITMEVMNKLVKTKTLEAPELTARELEFLRHCFTDLSYAEIAKKMGTTVRSIWGYRDSLFRKLNVHSRTPMVLLAIQTGLIPLNNFPYL